MRKERERLFTIWVGIRQRCLNKNNHGFKNYGGRGISVCSEWDGSYRTFRVWAFSNGYKDDLHIDRINNNGNYEPLNCRWVTQAENNCNNRRNKHVTAFGETKLLWHWFKDPRCPVNFRTVYQRLGKGYGYSEALFTPPTPIKDRKLVMRGCN